MQNYPGAFNALLLKKAHFALSIQVTFTAASAQDVHTFFYRPFRSSLLNMCRMQFICDGKKQIGCTFFRRVPLGTSPLKSYGRNKKGRRKKLRKGLLVPSLGTQFKMARCFWREKTHLDIVNQTRKNGNSCFSSVNLGEIKKMPLTFSFFKLPLPQQC